MALSTITFQTGAGEGGGQGLGSNWGGVALGAMQGNYFNIGAYHSDDFGAQLKRGRGGLFFFNKAIVFFPQ